MLRNLKSRITKFFYGVQLFLEEHNGLRIFLFIFNLILVVTLTIFFFSAIELNNFKKLIFISMGLIAIFFIIIDYLHFNMIKVWRGELDARKRLISDYIASEEPRYECLKLRETHHLLKSGDGIYKRKVNLRYSGNNTMFYSLDLGSTSSEGNFNKLHVEAIKYPDKTPLPRITFSTAPRKVKTIIILDPPLSPDNKEIEFEIFVYWPEIWNDAIFKNIDEGNIKIYNETGEVELFFYPPKQRNIIDFKMDDYPPEVLSDVLLNDDGSVYCKLTKPPRGIYKYFLNLD